MKKSLITIAFAIATSFAVQPAHSVVFGEDIERASTDYPWVVSIWHAGPKDDYYYPICSGSLIAPDAVLTAAHCLTKKGTYSVQIGSDTLDGENEKTFHAVAAIWKHPFYDDEDFKNDVGLIKLASYQTKVKPEPIADWVDLKAIRDSKSFELLGWGEDESGDYATFLGYAKLKNKTNEASLLLRGYEFETISTIAAGRYIKRLGVYAGSGGGDSGGPLVASINGIRKVAGITSWGKDYGDFSGPSAFINVAYQRAEIARGLNELQRIVLTVARAV
jgi:secreted trypsin-like serine protease